MARALIDPLSMQGHLLGRNHGQQFGIHAYTGLNDPFS